MQNSLNKLSKELNLPIETIEKIYKSYWKFIKYTIEELPLKEDLSEEEFFKLKSSFNITNLGKLHCSYSKYKTKKNVKYKKDKINR